MFLYIVSDDPCPTGCCRFTVKRQNPDGKIGTVTHTNSLAEATRRAGRYAQDRRDRGEFARVVISLNHCGTCGRCEPETQPRPYEWLDEDTPPNLGISSPAARERS